MEVVINLVNGGIIKINPFTKESKEDFYKRVKEILVLSFNIEDEKLYKEDDVNHAKVEVVKRDNDD